MSHFKALLAGSIGAAVLAAAPAAHSAVLNISVFDNGTLVGQAPPSTRGIATFSDDGTLDPNFSSINVVADGPLRLPNPDLSTVTLNISASTGFIGTHTLTIDIYQTGVLLPAGSTSKSTFTVNNLIGTPGPTTLSAFFNGTTNTLGTFLAGASFPAGVTNDTVGPISNTIGPALTADAEQYVISFTSPVESANDTIQLVASARVIPEPSTWAMLLLGFLGLGFVGYRASRKNEPAAA
jgi:hypothetical protein